MGTVNMHKKWNTTSLMASVEGAEQQFMKGVALRAKDIGRMKFQNIAPEHSDPGEYPAEQSGSAKQALDAGVFNTGIRTVARVGYYGAAAQKEAPGGETPVGEYMRYQALGAPGANLDPRPWHLIILELLQAESWDDLV